MNQHAKIFIVLLLVGVLGIVGYYFAKPYFEQKRKEEVSDGRHIKKTIRIGVDNWIGYFPLCSEDLEKRMRNLGYRLKCIEDAADYPQRMKKLKEAELDFAVATVDSFILNGKKQDYPGVIVMVIDQSKGGDAIVARKDKVKSIEDLKKLSNYRVALTPSSPSEHLLKSIAAHFEVSSLRDKNKNWLVETQGSTEALKKINKGEVEVAVLWEPDVSRALEDPEIIKILGTESTEKLIVDVLIVNENFLAEHPQVVLDLMANYFRVLKKFRDDPELLAKQVQEKVKLGNEKVKKLLEGVYFVNLYENAVNWFGIGSQGQLGHDGLTDTIESTIQVLQDHGDFFRHPLPNEDPYLIQNRRMVQTLFEKGLAASDSSVPAGTSSLERSFAALSDSQWDQLKEIGTLKIRPITFQSGTSDLDFQGKEQLDLAANNLKHYPSFRLVIKGHTAVKGEAEANLKLSQDRAEAVKRYLNITHNVNPNRIRSLGFGGNQPLPRKPGESNRQYEYRLPRVELSLVSEVF